MKYKARRDREYGEKHVTIKVCDTLEEAKKIVDKKYNTYIEFVEDKKERKRK